MALIPFHDFCDNNAYGLTAQKLRYSSSTIQLPSGY